MPLHRGAYSREKGRFRKGAKEARSRPAPRQDSYGLCPYGRTENTLIVRRSPLSRPHCRMFSYYLLSLRLQSKIDRRASAFNCHFSYSLFTLCVNDTTFVYSGSFCFQNLLNLFVSHLRINCKKDYDRFAI